MKKGNHIFNTKRVFRLIFYLMIGLMFFYDGTNNQINAQTHEEILQREREQRNQQRPQQETRDQNQQRQQETQDRNQQTPQQRTGESEQQTPDQRESEADRERIEEEALKDKSRIERMFYQTYQISLQQYGYDNFREFNQERIVSVSDTYIVGPGDTIALYFWGYPVDVLNLNQVYTLSVDNNGKIFVPSIGVFYVWNLSLARVRQLIHTAMARKYKRFQIDVTLGQLREFPVYVSGYVVQPGIKLVTGTNNVLDIISLAGGVAKNGSLRNIVIKRKEKGKIKEIKIDLYDLFIDGKPMDVKIKDGDTILVSAIGNTVGVSGVVKRPAIYELSTETNTIADVVKMVGGTLASASPSIKLFRYGKDAQKVSEGNLQNNVFLQTVLKDGDYLLIDNLYNLVENEIIIEGEVGYPGKYPYKPGLKLSQLIYKIGILPDTNKYYAEIKRKYKNKVINFVPDDVIKGRKDFALEKRDIINFYPRWTNEPIFVAGEVNNPRMIPYYDNITLLDVLKDIDLKKSAEFLKAEIYGEKLRTVYLYDLLYRASEESNFVLAPGVKVLIKSTEPSEKRKSITLLGEVEKPGIYNLESGLTLYNIIKKAGGYTKDSYPRGLIFIRNSAKKLQEQQIRISLINMKEYLAKHRESYGQLGSAEERSVLQMVVSQYEQMIAILEEKSKMALGRIALDMPAELRALKGHPDNIRLIEDDYIYVPPKPSYVLVLGNVYNQMSLPYDSGKTVRYYLSQLGGFAKSADEDDIYVIKANGKIISKQQLSTIFKVYFMVDWDRNKLHFARDFANLILEEGDAIVVPTEIKVPVQWRPMLRDISQIMFQSMSTYFMMRTLADR